QLNVHNNRLQHQHQQQQYPQKNAVPVPPVNHQPPQSQRSCTLNSVSPTLEKSKRNQKPKSTNTTAPRVPSASKVQKPYPKSANTQQRTPSKKQSKDQLQTPPQSQSQTGKQSQAPITPTTPTAFNPLQFQKYRSLFTGSTDKSQSITSQTYDSTMEKAKLLTQGILSSFQYEENLQ
ncbi:hypothetical protein WICPIJ_001348, partial [Wickerhamomyces pijperi]